MIRRHRDCQGDPNLAPRGVAPGELNHGHLRGKRLTERLAEPDWGMADPVFDHAHGQRRCVCVSPPIDAERLVDYVVDLGIKAAAEESG